MPASRINCPNCRQPIQAEIIQLFDVGQDPRAKQLFLSGTANMAVCPHCGYHGALATPIVYHDPSKELLLSYMPPELNIPRNDQERLIGQLISQVVNALPQEKRKAYLLTPSANLTLQGMIERVLAADGITKEMLQAQQDRIRLIQRLLSVSEDAQMEIARQELHLMDEQFFGYLNRLVEAAASGGDQASAQAMAELQGRLMPMTEFGRKVQEQSQEVEAAITSLQALGNGLTREKLLDLIIQAPSATRRSAYVSLARGGMDYEFFGILTKRIDEASGEEQENLRQLRNELLEMTKVIDQRIEAQRQQVLETIDTLVEMPDLQEALLQNAQIIDEMFVETLQSELEAARKKGDLARSGKLNQMMQVIQELSTPPEMRLVEELMDLQDDAAIQRRLAANPEMVNDQFMQILMGLAGDLETRGQRELAERFTKIYRMALRLKMQSSFTQ